MSGFSFFTPLRWKLAATVVAVVAALFAGMGASVFALSHLVVHKFLDNYDWQIRNALREGNIATALRIASARVMAEDFDFNARRLLAQALMRDGQISAAVEILLGSLDRSRGIDRRKTYSRGYNSAADYELLSNALKQQERNAFAHEMTRAGADERRLAAWQRDNGDDKQTPPLEADPPADMQLIDLTTFRVPEGAATTEQGSIHFSRSVAVTGLISGPNDGVSSIWLQVSGGRPMGFGSLLKVALDGGELIRIYANTDEPRWIEVPLHNQATAGTMELTAQFLNDEFDPVSKADRNVELLNIGVSGAITGDEL